VNVIYEYVEVIVRAHHDPSTTYVTNTDGRRCHSYVLVEVDGDPGADRGMAADCERLQGPLLQN
jgi:hypothetical protein